MEGIGTPAGVERTLGLILGRLEALELSHKEVAFKVNAVHDQTQRWRGGIGFVLTMSGLISAVIGFVVGAFKHGP